MISNYLLPLYFGSQRTPEVRPLILKCLPSNSEHCCSRKSFLPFRHESVLHDRNFILRPTQYFPPFLGLKKETNVKYTQFLKSLFSTKVAWVTDLKEKNLKQHSATCYFHARSHLLLYCACIYTQVKWIKSPHKTLLMRYVVIKLLIFSNVYYIFISLTVIIILWGEKAVLNLMLLPV